MERIAPACVKCAQSTGVVRLQRRLIAPLVHLAVLQTRLVLHPIMRAITLKTHQFLALPVSNLGDQFVQLVLLHM